MMIGPSNFSWLFRATVSKTGVNPPAIITAIIFVLLKPSPVSLADCVATDGFLGGRLVMLVVVVVVIVVVVVVVVSTVFCSLGGIIGGGRGRGDGSIVSREETR